MLQSVLLMFMHVAATLVAACLLLWLVFRGPQGPRWGEDDGWGRGGPPGPAGPRGGWRWRGLSSRQPDRRRVAPVPARQGEARPLRRRGARTRAGAPPSSGPLGFSRRSRTRRL